MPFPFWRLPFDFARWRVLRLIPAQWEGMGALPPEFRLYADRSSWPYRHRTRCLSAPCNANSNSALEGEDGEPGAGSATNQWTAVVAERTAELLSDPVAADWVRLGPAAILTLPDAFHSCRKRNATRWCTRCWPSSNNEPYGKQLPTAMAAGLRTQAAWFELAGYPQTAERSSAAGARHAPCAHFAESTAGRRLLETALRRRRVGTLSAPYLSAKLIPQQDYRSPLPANSPNRRRRPHSGGAFLSQSACVVRRNLEDAEFLFGLFRQHVRVPEWRPRQVDVDLRQVRDTRHGPHAAYCR